MSKYQTVLVTVVPDPLSRDVLAIPVDEPVAVSIISGKNEELPIQKSKNNCVVYKTVDCGKVSIIVNGK